MAKKWTERSDTEIYVFMIAIFVSLGIVIGAWIDQVTLGIAIGAALAVVFAESVKARRPKRDDR